jgi:hydroxymethylglutaryl-CoA synthase
MAKKGLVLLRQCDLEDRLGRALSDAEKAADEPAAAASFETQVAPSLALPARIGNTYTAALYFGLASLLHTQAASLSGKRIGMFSYGSGCTSEFFSGTVGPRAAEVIARAGLDAAFENRRRIGIEEYERIMNLPPAEPPAEPPAAGEFRFTGVNENRRTYARG